MVNQPTCISCSEEISIKHQRSACSECKAAAHVTYSFLQPSNKFCENAEIIEVDAQKVKARQEKQAQGILDRSARRFAPALVGDNIRVYLSEVDRGRCAGCGVGSYAR